MRKPQIIILERKPEEAHIITRLLMKSLPCNVDVAFSIKELVNALEKEDYDVLIADVIVEGFEVDYVLNRLEELKKRTVVYLFIPYFDENYMIELAKKGVHFPVLKSAKGIEWVAVSIKNLFETLWRES